MNEIGVLGLGVMGKSLAKNIANNDFSISVYNRSGSSTKELVENINYQDKIDGFYDLKSFVNSLKVPRVIVLMTKAGEVVDLVIEQLLEFLEAGDIIVDGSNALYKDTDRRLAYLNDKGIKFLGLGISGGESGALNGPSMMPGGDIEVYKHIKYILDKIAAKSKYGICSNYIGNAGAGHYVKMVHNAIEYAMMQSIAEVYHYLKVAKKLSNQEMSEVFNKWNQGKLNSYLMDITVEILLKADDKSENDLIDMILDKAAQKGTGKWTVESALDLSVPTPTLINAVTNRNISFFKELRVEMNELHNYEFEVVDNLSLEQIENALIFSNMMAFSQGLWLISEASKVYDYNIDLINVLKTWSDGCIIRAYMLDEFIEIIEANKDNSMLLNDKKVVAQYYKYYGDVNDVVYNFNKVGVSASSITISLQYFLSMTSGFLPMNLMQAQRDYFGAHTYERIDKEGDFHTIWED